MFSSLFSQSEKYCEVIQAFLFALYSNGFDFTFLKHLGFSDFPIISKGSFSVQSMLAPTNNVTLSLLFLPRLKGCSLNDSVLSAVH